MQRQNSFSTLAIAEDQTNTTRSPCCFDDLDLLLDFAWAELKTEGSEATVDLDEQIALFPSKQRSLRILEKSAAGCSDVLRPPPPSRFTRAARKLA